MRRALAALAAVLALGGCAGDDGDSLTVFAAASLRGPLEQYADRFEPARARLSFAGSDELAAQIRQGVGPDVYAAANTDLPEALHREGLVEKPVVFARNRLVIAVPANSKRIRRIEDLASPGTKLAIGSDSVPIGRYARERISRLPPQTERRILANVRSTEPDVRGVVGKVAQGAVDAGFVYATDVAAARGDLEAIDAASSVAYGIAVVEGAPNPDAARSFVDGILGGEGRQILVETGFQAP